MRFVNKVSTKRPRKNNKGVAGVSPKSVEPTVELPAIEELEQAEECILKICQALIFSAELGLLRANKPLPNNNKIVKLNPILKDILTSLGGRIDNSDLSYDSKHPIILTKNMPVAELIVKDLHVKFGHAGRQFVLTKLREKY